MMGRENRQAGNRPTRAPPPPISRPLLNKAASARRGTSSNATPLVLNEFMYGVGCEHALGEGGEHRLASGQITDYWILHDK